ncbi:MAG: hypothetical protein ABWY00_09795 [Dongiaceae bacterium]
MSYVDLEKLKSRSLTTIRQREIEKLVLADRRVCRSDQGTASVPFRTSGLLHCDCGGLTDSNSERRGIAAASHARDPIAAIEAAFQPVQNGKDRLLALS